MRRALWVLPFLVGADPALAGNNASGKAWLSWDRDRVITRLAEPPSTEFPLFLQLASAPDLRSLAVDLRWATGDSMGCYRFVSSPAELACGWATDTLPGGPFEGDSSFTWTISFAPGSAKTCITYTVTAANCAASDPARFWLASVRAKDSKGSVDSLRVLGQVVLGPDNSTDGKWRLQGSRLAHQDACAIYDPIRDRILVFGVVSNQVWELPLTGRGEWQYVAISGERPRPRPRAGAVYDPVRDRMIVLGGWDGTRSLTMSGHSISRNEGGRGWSHAVRPPDLVLPRS